MKDLLKNLLLLFFGGVVTLSFSPGLRNDQIESYTGDASGTSEFEKFAESSGTLAYKISYEAVPGRGIVASLKISINDVPVYSCNGNANGNARLPENIKTFVCGSYAVSKGDRIKERHFVAGSAGAQNIERRFRYNSLVCNYVNLFC
jgi:hypothetical protein